LNTIARAPYSSVNRPWNQQPVTGLRLDPTSVPGASVIVDWISLTGESGCGTFDTKVNGFTSVGNSKDGAIY